MKYIFLIAFFFSVCIDLFSQSPFQTKLELYYSRNFKTIKTDEITKLYKTGEYKTLLIKMDKEISVNPTNCEAYFMRGVAKCMLNEYKNGLSDLEVSEKLGYSQTGLYMTKALAKNALNDYKGAKNDVSKAIQKDPHNLVAFLTRAQISLSLNDKGSSDKDFSYVIKICTENINKHLDVALNTLYRAGAEAYSGDTEGACRDIKMLKSHGLNFEFLGRYYTENCK